MSVKSRLRAVNLNYRKLESPNHSSDSSPNDREKGNSDGVRIRVPRYRSVYRTVATDVAQGRMRRSTSRLCPFNRVAPRAQTPSILLAAWPNIVPLRRSQSRTAATVIALIWIASLALVGWLNYHYWAGRIRTEVRAMSAYTQ